MAGRREMRRKHALRFTVSAASADEAEALAVDQCVAYYGTRPYNMELIASPEVETIGDGLVSFTVEVSSWTA